MRKMAIAALLGCLFVTPGYSQFKGFINKVKSRVDQRVDNKVNNSIDKTLDKAEGKNSTAAATPAGGSDAEGTPKETGGIKVFSKYDFVPGEKVLYAEDFAQEAIGELPTGWNSSGSGEVVKLDKYPGQWLRLHKALAYLTANDKTFGQNYTVEFDLILQLKTNGWMFPEFKVSLLSSRDKAPGDNELLRGYEQYSTVTATLFPSENNNSKARVTSMFEKARYFFGDPISIAQLQNWYGTPVHVAIQVQKERFRCWINDLKAFDVPKAVPLTDTMNQLRFEVSSTNYTEETYGVYIGNVKVATGLPDTRHKLIEEGRFSTNGILFDLQSAVIRPESYGVIKEIAGVLKENPSIRVKVVGHTSSDGDDAANMELSRKRSASVKDMLAGEFQIDASRIETTGMGETAPIADNKTKEGRSQNRRVEFIKI